MTDTTTNINDIKLQAQSYARSRFNNTDMYSVDDLISIGMAGTRFGWNLSTSLDNFDNVRGKLSLSAEAMVALARKAGHSVKFGEVEVDKDGTPCSASVVGERADTGDTHSVTFTRQDAERAKLWGGPTWKTYPRAMLQSRAASELARKLFPDVLVGMSYTPEEVASFQPAETKPKPTTIKRSNLKRDVIEIAGGDKRAASQLWGSREVPDEVTKEEAAELLAQIKLDWEVRCAAANSQADEAELEAQQQANDQADAADTTADTTADSPATDVGIDTSNGAAAEEATQQAALVETS